MALYDTIGKNYIQTDSFAAVGWGRPELYLDARIRNGISSFSKMTDIEIDRGLARFRNAGVGSKIWILTPTARI